MAQAEGIVTTSIIIPCYNHAAFLAEAITSAQQQTGCEVIVVDDGSTDGSAAIASAISGVRVIRQANAGLGAARNAGLAAATGEFVCFLDADDRLLPKAIQAGHAALMRDARAAFAAGGFQRIDRAGHVVSIEQAAPVGDSPYASVLMQSPFPMHAALLFRRAAVQAAGGYDPELRACEDFDLYCRLLRTQQWTRHDAIVAAYRRHDHNMSGDARRMVSAALTVMGRQWPHVRHDPALRQAFHSGVRFWVTAFSNDTVWPAATGHLWRGGRPAMRGALILWRHVPRWTLECTLDRWRAWAERRWARLHTLMRRLGGAGTGATRALHARESRVPRAFSQAPGQVDFGELRRLDPVDRHFGFSRGWPVDRHYVDAFIERHAADVRGRVLEVKDAAYTRRFGADRVERAEVLDIDPANPLADHIADLTDAPGMPDDSYDCIVLTQTLHVIYDVRGAIRTVHRLLRPGGVVLATVPGITKVDRTSPWFWSFTDDAARRLFREIFGDGAVDVESFGNLLAATAFLQGLALSELTPEELAPCDPEYPVVVCIRAVKGA